MGNKYLFLSKVVGIFTVLMEKHSFSWLIQIGLCKVGSLNCVKISKTQAIFRIHFSYNILKTHL